MITLQTSSISPSLWGSPPHPRLPEVPLCLPVEKQSPGAGLLSIPHPQSPAVVQEQVGSSLGLEREAPTAALWCLGWVKQPITPLTLPCSSTGFTPTCLPGERTWGWFCLELGGLLFVYLFMYLLALRICLSHEFTNNTGQIYFCCQTNSEQNFSFVKSHTCKILR